MWRSAVVLGRKQRGGPKLRSSIEVHAQVNRSRANTAIQYEQPPFHSHFPSSTWLFSKSSILQSHRFFSHYLSDPLISDERSSIFETCKDEVSIDASSSVFGETTSSSISSDFFEEQPASASSSTSIFDETGDNLKMHGFASGNDEPTMENEVQEVDLGRLESATMDGFASGNDEVDVENEVQEVDLELLQSVLSLLQSSGGTSEGSLGSSLENMGLPLHEDFVVSVLEAPLVPGENLIGFFEWVLKMPEFSLTTRAVEALVRAICNQLRVKDAYALWDLVKEVGETENGVLNNEILNQLISLFSRLGKGRAGFEVFNKFGEFGCVPDADTYFFTIEALCRCSIYDWASSICEKMLNGEILPDSDKVGKIISFLCKGDKAKDAHFVYLLAREREKYPPRSSVNFLITSLCRNDATVHLASGMLDDFSGEERKYAIRTFSSVIRGLSKANNVEGAKKLLFKMIDAGPPPGNAVFNSIISCLSKAGDMDKAMEMVKVMENRGLKPDVYTYSVIMSGYVKGGAMEEACEVLAEAKKKHAKLNPVTYHSLIRGYCNLEMFDEALKLLGEMKEYGVQPNADEYNKLIQSLCLKKLDWATAEKLLEEMQENGLHLNAITRGLIRAVKELEEEGIETTEVSIEA